MKKFLFPALTMAMAFVATSCSSDEPGVAPEGNFTPTENQTITLKVTSPDGGIRSRGQDANGWYGDGVDAEELQYCIYERTTDGTTKIIASSDNATDPVPVKVDADNNSWNLSVSIPSGIKWDIYFFADYWGKGTTGNNTKVEWAQSRLHYYGNCSQGDMADAFFGTKSSESYATDIEDGDEPTVGLRRPFMQVNVLSNELDNKTLAAAFPQGIDVTMQFGNGSVVGIPEYYYFKEDRLTFKKNTLDSGAHPMLDTQYKKVTYNGKQYDLLFMGYYLAPKKTTNATDWSTAPSRLLFNFYKGGTTTLSNSITVPFTSLGTNPYTQNTRVIIYTDATAGGGFISDNATFRVDVTPSWGANGGNYKYE